MRANFECQDHVVVFLATAGCEVKYLPRTGVDTDVRCRQPTLKLPQVLQGLAL
jgi:hypothetical protein